MKSFPKITDFFTPEQLDWLTGLGVNDRAKRAQKIATKDQKIECTQAQALFECNRGRNMDHPQEDFSASVHDLYKIWTSIYRNQLNVKDWGSESTFGINDHWTEQYDMATIDISDGVSDHCIWVDMSNDEYVLSTDDGEEIARFPWTDKGELELLERAFPEWDYFAFLGELPDGVYSVGTTLQISTHITFWITDGRFLIFNFGNISIDTAKALIADKAEIIKRERAKKRAKISDKIKR